MYVNADASDAVLFVSGHGLQFWELPRRIRLAGLDAGASYRLEGEKLLRSPTRGTGPYIAAGGALMTIGPAIDLHGDFDSTVIRIRRLDA